MEAAQRLATCEIYGHQVFPSIARIVLVLVLVNKTCLYHQHHTTLSFSLRWSPGAVLIFTNKSVLIAFDHLHFGLREVQGAQTALDEN